jgi:hypothetical protein
MPPYDPDEIERVIFQRATAEADAMTREAHRQAFAAASLRLETELVPAEHRADYQRRKQSVADLRQALASSGMLVECPAVEPPPSVEMLVRGISSVTPSDLSRALAESPQEDLEAVHRVLVRAKIVDAVTRLRGTRS